jgi:hypothetical protein
MIKKIVVMTFILIWSYIYGFSHTSVYMRGIGANNNVNRLVRLNGQNIGVPSTDRGLVLTIINANTHQAVSSVRYDTWASTQDSNNLDTALNNLNSGQIGILSSYDAWENQVTQNLRVAARRLGLYKLGSGIGSGSKHPYAAIFKGSGTGSSNSQANHIAYEVMQSRESGAERAVIATWLIEDAFVGSNITNALFHGNGETVGAALLVNHQGFVGIGTPSPDSELTVKGKIHAQEVQLDLNGAVAPDYVFDKDYLLMSLEEVEKYIADLGYLPGIPSASEMENLGMDLKPMNLKLLEKLEELTLHLIRINVELEQIIMNMVKED